MSYLDLASLLGGLAKTLADNHEKLDGEPLAKAASGLQKSAAKFETTLNDFLSGSDPSVRELEARALYVERFRLLSPAQSISGKPDRTRRYHRCAASAIHLEATNSTVVECGQNAFCRRYAGPSAFLVIPFCCPIQSRNSWREEWRESTKYLCNRL
jgi:hypothetical protein